MKLKQTNSPKISEAASHTKRTCDLIQ